MKQSGPTATNPRIRYAQCWEDADVLLQALDVQPGDVHLVQTPIDKQQEALRAGQKDPALQPA